MRILPERELGRITVEQFERMAHALPELRGIAAELPKVLRSNPEKFSELFGPSEHSWAGIYELPFFEQLSALVILIGMHEPLLDAWRSDDPLERYSHWGEKDSELDRWYEANSEKINPKHLLWLAIVFQRNILSIMLYHCSMGHLVERVRDGDDEAFFDAVRIDRAVLGCPTFADRLARAEASGDKSFFVRLRNAVKGLLRKHMAAIQDLRYSIVALRAFGFDRFSDADLIRLFVQTKLYPNSAGALKNLRKHIQAARKLQPPDLINSGGRPGPD